MASEPALAIALKRLFDWINSQRVPAAVVGGVAASIHGGARLTKDIDLLARLPESEWKQFLEAGKKFGFQARVKDALSFARKSRVLLATHEPTGIAADIIAGGLSFEDEAIERAIQVSFEDFAVRVVTVEDLIVMKAVANRPRDLADIEAVLDRNPRADVKKARAWIREFSSVLGTPRILHDFDDLVGSRGKQKQRKPRLQKKATPKRRGS